MKINIENEIFKGPITCCEYFDEDHVLVGCGPYLTVLKADSFEKLCQVEILKFRVIHGILVNSEKKQILVYGQKAFNICSYNAEKSELITVHSSCIEINDWIWAMNWLPNSNKLAIVAAHNQFIQLNSENNQIEKSIFCSQKCMLYSAKIIQYNQKTLVAAGTIFNQILIWDPDEQGRVLLTLAAHQGVIFNIVFNPVENFLFSVSDDRSIIVWQLKNEYAQISGEVHTRFFGHDARVWKCVWFRSEGKVYLCSVGEDLKCCLWNVNEKKLAYRFNAQRKGSKNIWSVCLNAHCGLITGWADGGLRKYDLKSFVKSDIMSEIELGKKIEFGLDFENENDFARNVLVVEDKIFCCTNSGAIYSAKLNEFDGICDKKFIFFAQDLCSYNCMAKSETPKLSNYIAIGSLNGSVYLLYNLKQEIASFKTLDCALVETKFSEKTYEEIKAQSKVFNLKWSEGDDGNLYLLVSLTFLNGVMHLYKLNAEKSDLELVARFILQDCKQRWFTSFVKTNKFLFVGDKMGNLHYYEFINEIEEAIHPKQTIASKMKNGAAVSALFWKDNRLVMCSKDGFYSLYKFDSDDGLSFVNRFEINSEIDLIESLVFDFDKRLNSELSNENFDLEKNLLLALCFYGDKFLIWNFFSNRSLMEIKCGGANRSWDIEIAKSGCEKFTIKFVYLKQKKFVIVEKMFHKDELIPQSTIHSNHLLQIFHGNNITCCKYFKNYLITGSEDTQLIISDYDKSITKSLCHKFHLQGHDSVIKCIDSIEIDEKTFIMVSAGGKANLKIWKILIENDMIKQIVQLCEFKRFYNKQKNIDNLNEDASQANDIRFMDLNICNASDNILIIYFACSDGFIRIFKYDQERNKLHFMTSIEYPKCLLCIRYLKAHKSQSYLICTSTDGNIIVHKIQNEEIEPNSSKIIKAVHQSGINWIDLYQSEDEQNVLVATCGDDTSFNVAKFSFSDDGFTFIQLIKKENAHSSSIMSIKFLTENTVLTISKDQRLIIWRLNYEKLQVENFKIKFSNIADVTSMDVLKLNNKQFQISLVGNGLEILKIEID